MARRLDLSHHEICDGKENNNRTQSSQNTVYQQIKIKNEKSKVIQLVARIV